MSATRPGTALMVWNVVALNIGWWSCVLGAALGPVWLGPAVIAVLVAIHLALVPCRQRELATLAAVGLIGYAADSLLVLAGAFEFPAAARVGAPSTVWMVALWVNFATSLNVALYWLVKRPWLGAVLGAIGGPLAYVGGWQFDALLAPSGPWVLTAWVAVQWALATPLMLAVAVHIGRRLRQPVPLESAGAPA
ncbi:MAG: DUF2878 domain-containing protein [Halofilum sp. (in: g-proteobacteria)]|nr:DUF2878 domain-containing protein [Halofilum sp. (in: g-proteobacteria)]